MFYYIILYSVILYYYIILRYTILYIYILQYIIIIIYTVYIYVYTHERSLQNHVQYFENWLMPLTMVRPQLGVIPCKTGFLTMVTNLQLEFQ